MNENNLDRKELKIKALLQRIAELTASYEDQDANRRIEITELTLKYNELLNNPTEE